MEILNNFLATLEGWPPFVIYLALFIFAFVENVFPPSPGDTFVIFGAFLAGQKIIDPYLVFLVTAVGSLLSIMLIYNLARLKGKDFFLKRNFCFLRKKRIPYVEDSFARHGEKIIITSRFFVGVRTIVIILAGIAGVSKTRMLFFSAIGIAFWHGILIYAGYEIGDNWQQIVVFLGIYNKLIISTLAAILCFYLIRIFSKNWQPFDW